MKLHTILLLIITLFATQAKAQRGNPDLIELKKGSLTVQPIEHATFVLRWDNKTIYVDPTGGAEAFAVIAPPDVILVTDIHPDHFHPETLQAIQTANTVLVVPQAVAAKLPSGMKAKIVVLKNGDRTGLSGMVVNAIPMYNIPQSADAFHTRGRGNGYVLEIEGKHIYISGDTEDIPEMKALKNIDVAFVCMNQPYTMTVEQAAIGVLAFKPKVVYPYHYRGKDGLSDIQKFKENVTNVNKAIEVRFLDWYPKK